MDTLECGFKTDLEFERKVAKHYIIKTAFAEGRNLTEPEAYRVMEDYSIPVPPYGIAGNAKEAAKISANIGFPVVLKIISPDILHKSDVGGVRLGIFSKTEAEKAYEEILQNVSRWQPEAKVEGILVAGVPRSHRSNKELVNQKDVLEVIIGAVKDPEFGFAVMFGLGGIFVEIAKDVTFRVVPITREDVIQMMSGIKAAMMLEGIRGRDPRDKNALVDIVLSISFLVQENPCITAVDLNPVFSFDKGACVVDAKITL